jgi:hypothetical protein
VAAAAVFLWLPARAVTDDAADAVRADEGDRRLAPDPEAVYVDARRLAPEEA